MKRYKIVETIMVSFLGRSGTLDYLIGPDDGYILEVENGIIWVRKSNEIRQESITVASAIRLWEAQGRIKEL